MEAYRQITLCRLTLRHRQQTTQLIDLTGKTERLSLQHARRVALVPLFDQIGETIVERGQLAKQPIKLLLNRRPPSLQAGVQNDLWRFLFLCAHGQIGSKSHAVLQQESAQRVQQDQVWYIEQDDPAVARRVALHIIHNVETLLPNSPETGRPGRVRGHVIW
jgi:hypothetical protein